MGQACVSSTGTSGTMTRVNYHNQARNWNVMRRPDGSRKVVQDNLVELNEENGWRLEVMGLAYADATEYIAINGSKNR